MTLAELLVNLKYKKVRGRIDKEIRGITYDSRDVKNGYLFIAIKGLKTDGHNFIDDAVNRGAAGVVLERKVDLQNETAFIEVENSRKALAFLSADYYGDPSRELSLIGITGTNGKTTSSYILRSILETWQGKVGLIGSIQYIINEKTLMASRTTPESLELQGYFRKMADSGVRYAVLEVSSHALALERIEGCRFKVAVFTNFSQDHLDFHGNMEEYFKAKTRIFNYLQEDGCAVLNWDDPIVKSLAGKLKCRVVTCGTEEGAMIKAGNVKDCGFRTLPAGRQVADFGLRDKKLQNQKHGQRTTLQKTGGQAGNRQCGGLSFDIQTPEYSIALDSGLVGRNNIYNILMSVGAAYALGASKDAILKGISRVEHIEGRFEKIDEGQPFLCLVDYAHTEEALCSLIKEAKLITEGKVITVFGCGGDRDKTKRSKMGETATKLSDFVIITSDNPRSEDPMKIIKDITAGAVKDNYSVQPDRAKAIKEAVLMAEKGDALLIAGKGHEKYQEIMGIQCPFSDKEVLKEELRRRIAV